MITSILFSDENIDLGKFDIKEFESLLKIKDVDIVSSAFLGTPYLANSLIGSSVKDEVFVVNLSGMDCFTYVDYIESMRRVDSYKMFLSELKKVRYKGSRVSYKLRRHFFSDWIGSNVKDITYDIGGDMVKTVHKFLNQKKSKKLYLAGIDIVEREISYLPSNQITHELLSQLRSGDYIGIYTNLNGLDVTHVGIFIRKGEKFIFRHASSSKKNHSVVDSDFLKYIKSKEGIIAYRPSIPYSDFLIR